jgi:hypothetical protein
MYGIKTHSLILYGDTRNDRNREYEGKPFKKEIEEIGDRIPYMKPEIIEEVAESCEPDEL